MRIFGTWSLLACVLVVPSGDPWNARSDSAKAHQGVVAGVTFANALDGWAWVRSKSPRAWPLERTRDGGKSWRMVSVYAAETGGGPPPQPNFVNGNLGFMAVARARGPWPYVFERTHDGGRTWTVLRGPRPAMRLPLTSFDFLDSRHGWAVFATATGMGQASSELYRTINAGLSWQLVAFTNVKTGGVWRSKYFAATSAPGAVAFATPTRGWAVGSSSHSGMTVAYRTRDGGLRWHVCLPLRGSCGPALPPWYQAHRKFSFGSGNLLETPMGSPRLAGGMGLLPVSISTQVGAALHYRYYMYRLVRSGKAWGAPMLMPLGFPHILCKCNPNGYTWVQADIAGLRAWYFVGGDRLATTLDGGHRWRYHRLPLGRGSVLAGIQFFGSTGYLLTDRPTKSGGEVLTLHRSRDAGATWSRVAIPPVAG